VVFGIFGRLLSPESDETFPLEIMICACRHTSGAIVKGGTVVSGAAGEKWRWRVEEERRRGGGVEVVVDRCGRRKA